MSLSIFCPSVLATHELASWLISQLRVNTPHNTSFVIGISGNLGAGKTEFVRGIAKSLGIQGEITSPTFVIETIYDLQNLKTENSSFVTLRHLDLYRLSKNSNLEGILGDLGNVGAELVIIEWPERIELVKDLLSLQIEINFASEISDDEASRVITITSTTAIDFISKVNHEFKLSRILEN